jgi:stage V sporulation protein SpoVS/cold shock CspA family protein
MQGVVRKYVPESKFGFIEVVGGATYFFHDSDFDPSGLGPDQQRENVAVEFTPTTGPKGLRAAKVRVATIFANDTQHFVELRVASATAPRELAGSIALNVLKGKTVKLLAIGHGAVAQAIKAVPIASERTIANGFLLAIVPSFDTKNIAAPDEVEVERTLTVMQIIKVRPPA